MKDKFSSGYWTGALVMMTFCVIGFHPACATLPAPKFATLSVNAGCGLARAACEQSPETCPMVEAACKAGATLAVAFSETKGGPRLTLCEDVTEQARDADQHEGGIVGNKGTTDSSGLLWKNGRAWLCDVELSE